MNLLTFKSDSLGLPPAYKNIEKDFSLVLPNGEYSSAFESSSPYHISDWSQAKCKTGFF